MVYCPGSQKEKMLVDALKQKFPQMPNLRVRDIRVDKVLKRVYCVISYPDVSSLDGNVRGEMRAVVQTSMPKGYRSEVQFANDKFNDRSFAALVIDYIKKRFPLFADTRQYKISAKVQDFNATATFNVNKFTKRNMEIAEFTSQLSAFFASYSCYNVQFLLVEDNNITVDNVDIENQERLVHLAINKEMLKPQRYFNVTDVVKHIGKEIVAKPMYISDIRAPMDSCVICGKISEKELRAVKNNAILKLCKFNLTDGSGATMPCLMFVRFKIDDVETIKQTTGKPDSEARTISEKQRLSNDKRMKKLAFLSDGLEVVVRGKVVYSQFSQRLELQMYDICKCRIEPINLQPKFKRGVPDSYVLVRPEPVEEYRQLTLMQLEERPSILEGKNCVALFANVTGYTITKDKIFALCGVRLLNGHLKEKLFTCVLPEMDLSEQQLKETNLSVKQLSLSPTLTEIIGDLFKFVAESILVGDNLFELLELLNYYAAPLGFNFSNKTISTADAFQRLFENSTVDSRPVYSQLEEVAKALKLDCKITANCEDKAMAVAKCMSFLASNAK